eukprot:scaffold80_cov325-Pavlova_lutheri.AAC.23
MPATGTLHVPCVWLARFGDAGRVATPARSSHVGFAGVLCAHVSSWCFGCAPHWRGVVQPGGWMWSRLGSVTLLDGRPRRIKVEGSEWRRRAVS